MTLTEALRELNENGLISIITLDGAQTSHGRLAFLDEKCFLVDRVDSVHGWREWARNLKPDQPIGICCDPLTMEFVLADGATVGCLLALWHEVIANGARVLRVADETYDRLVDADPFTVTPGKVGEVGEALANALIALAEWPR